MTIDQVHKFIDFIVKKSNAGGYITPAEKDLLLNRAQIQYFNKLYGNQNDYRYDRPVPKISYAVTEKISDSLAPFLSNKTVIAVNNTGRFITSSLDNFFHIAAVSNTVVDSPGNILAVAVDNPGSGYASNPTITIAPPINTGTTAVATPTLSQGSLASVTVSNQGTNYTALPIVTISAPAAVSFDASASAVSVANDTITINSHPFKTGDKVLYSNAGGTSITAAGLVSGAYVYLIKVNANTIKLSGSYDSAVAGAALNITAVGTGTQTFTGETATGTAIGVAQEEYEITRVEQDRLATNLASYYDYPDSQNCIYTQFNGYIQFYPINIATANLIYLKKPANMVWGYTLNGSGRQVYSEALSTNPVWYDTDMNEIIYLALSYIGVNLKDPDVSQFANMKTQTGL
jgi:hypothetical protein